MTNRIQELIQQATFETGGLFPREKFDREVFAELLIEDCAMVCDRQSRASWNDDRKMQARLDRDEIRKHFDKRVTYTDAIVQSLYSKTPGYVMPKVYSLKAYLLLGLLGAIVVAVFGVSAAMRAGMIF